MQTPEIICAGMVVVDVLVDGMTGLPSAGETGLVNSVSLATGGDAINEAMSLAKLGNRVGLMGLIGDDAQGRFILERCQSAGIDTLGLFVDPDRSTSTSVVLIEQSGERSFLSARDGAIGAYGPEHVDFDLIQPGLKALSIGSLFTSKRFDLDALPELLRRAKAVGAITLADMVMDQRDYGLAELDEIWPYLDYVIPSELEAAIFTGSSDPAETAAAFRDLGVGNVILKRGARGATGYFGGQPVEVPAFRVPVVDTTGAGDNFVAGLVHALVQRAAPDMAMRFASAVAALSVGAVGAGAGLRDLDQVTAFLREPA